MKLNLIKLAFRNIFRNKRRTVITLAAIIFGAVTIVILGGVLECSMQGLREQTIRSVIGGHLKIALDLKEGEQQNLQQTLIPEEMVKEIEAILEKQEHIKVFAKKIDGISGLVGNNDVSATFIADGIDPGKEAKLRSWANIIDGSRLKDDKPEGCLLGKGLAEAIKANVGDELTVVTSEGVLNAVGVYVQGIFETGTYEYDKRAMILTLQNSQLLLNVQGIRSFSILIDKTKYTDEVAENLRTAFAEKGLHLKVKTWLEDALYYRQVTGFLHGLFKVIKYIVMVIIAIGIANTILMSVMERTREIGTLNAIGFKTHQIIRLFLTEAGLLGIVGGIIGCIFGYFLINWVASLGIQVSPPPGSTTGFPLMPVIVPKEFLYAFCASVLIALVSAIYPATIASRMRPVDALRHI